MYRIILFLIFGVYSAHAQVFPTEGRKISYRIIGFTFPAQGWATGYDIEIANGTQTTEGDFYKNVINKIHSKSNRIIGEVPSFGRAYTWRIVFTAKDGGLTKSYLYHFSTLSSPDVDPAITRLRVTKSAEKYKDAYVFLDKTRALYNMKGQPVWFLPGSDADNQEVATRDMKLTPQGNITFMTGNQPYEIDYNGRVLWHNTGNVTDTFHHELTRLRNGHLMAMISEHEWVPLAAFKGRVAKNADDSSRFYQHLKMSDIVEYDEHDRIVWRWSGLNYLKNCDLSAHIPGEGRFDLNDLHENSFYFDETKNAVYLSIRNISRIIKIKYPEGTVMNTYGTMYKPGTSTMSNDLFGNQHSCKVSGKGNLYLFSNNVFSTTGIPTVVMMQEPVGAGGELKKIWDYTCTIEDAALAGSGKLLFHAGGNVVELPDQSIFVSMGMPYCKTFIVSHDKKILWSATPEKYDPIGKKWANIPDLYRASIITNRKDLEQLIWNSEKGL